MTPLLTAIEGVILTKAHLAEPVKISNLDKMFELGCKWDEIFGSAGALYQLAAVWVREWCAHISMLLLCAFGVCLTVCIATATAGKTDRLCALTPLSVD